MESTPAPLPIPPSSCEAPTISAKQMAYVDNFQPPSERTLGRLVGGLGSMVNRRARVI
jgi:hypothetical protein